MPDHDSDSLLNRQTKRRRVDIGVKRTVGSTGSSAAATIVTTDNIARAKAAIFSAMNSLSSHSHPGSDTDSMECSVVQPHGGPGVMSANDSESKSNVLRKLLKRANSYEDTMMPFPGTTIISQLLKNNMAKNGGGPERGERGDRGDRGDSGFPGSGLSNTSSDAPQEDACSNSSQDSTPQECLSPFGRPPGLATFDIERLSDEHLRAKRARVENIIRGMSHSPSVVVPAASRHERDHEMDGGREMELDCPPPQSQQQAPSSPRGGEVCSGSGSSRENKRKQRLPQQQQQSFTQLVCQRKEQKQEERRQLKLQLEDMQKQLRQLQEKFFQIYDSTDDSEHNDLHNDLHNDIGNMSEDSPARSDTGGDDRGGDDLRSDNEMSDLDPGHFLDRARALLQEQALLADREKPRREGLGRNKGQGGPGSSMHTEGKQLAETLKQELNSAMTQVVDTVVKVFAKPPRPTPQQAFPPLSIPPERFPTTVNGDTPNFHTANQRLQCFNDVIIPNPLDSFASMPGMPGTTSDQTEALPLVVRKTPSEHHHQSSAIGAHGGHHHPALHPSSLSASMGFSPPSFRHPFPLPLMGYPFQGPLGAPTGGYTGKDRSSPDSMDLSRETTSLRTKMASGHHLGHHHRSCSPAHPGSTVEGLSLSLIKSECSDLQDMADISPYSGSNIQEGLSPNHLKKAKLMFFYTRYPSSNMLKMFFSDVKFNRCITSQLIKWFSNFREFYYIQMEKFARQAINDGVTGAEELSLFRSLMAKGKKTFSVPDRFLEVAEITLREFFNAIVAGKDVDPSWKKAIYKVICKLDSEVPEIFKSPNCLQELLHE
uniref:Prospero domain-containing protein n=1 Tax=Monopterus albus TaxID=43700 RepID=A0A3Q3IQY6_MONAL